MWQFQLWSIQKPTNIQCGKPNNEPILESLDQAFQAKLASNTVAFGGRRTRGASCSPTTTGTRIFPECVARVPVSLWGSGGWGCVRSTSRFCSQPSATVRNRPQPFVWGPYGRAYGKFCRRVNFGRLPTFRCFVSRGRRGTLWHSDVFCNVSKVVLCGRRNTFATFSEDALQFWWQAQHFRRVVLRVFCESHWQGCVKWRQGANSVAGVAVCEMCWKLTEASHETSILRWQI